MRWVFDHKNVRKKNTDMVRHSKNTRKKESPASSVCTYVQHLVICVVCSEETRREMWVNDWPQPTRQAERQQHQKRLHWLAAGPMHGIQWKRANKNILFSNKRGWWERGKIKMDAASRITKSKKSFEYETKRWRKRGRGEDLSKAVLPETLRFMPQHYVLWCCYL